MIGLVIWPLNCDRFQPHPQVVKWGKIRVAILETGAFFGEAGFLCDPAMGSTTSMFDDEHYPHQQHHQQQHHQQRPRRWASVYSNTYCDVRYISRTKFEEVLQLCPDVSATEVRGLGLGSVAFESIERTDPQLTLMTPKPDPKQIRHMMLERFQEVLRDQAELEALCLSEYPEAKEAYEQEVGCF